MDSYLIIYGSFFRIYNPVENLYKAFGSPFDILLWNCYQICVTECSTFCFSIVYSLNFLYFYTRNLCRFPVTIL